MIEVRRIKANEAMISRDVRIRALTDAPYAFGGTLEDVLNQPLQDFEDNAKRWSESEVSTSFLAFDNEKAVGMAGAFFEEGSNRAFLCAMWVEPEYRQSGVGKIIVKTVISWLSERGADTVYAWVADANSNAIKFYQCLGFSATKEKEILASNPDETETLFRFSCL